jgi:predicted outer membrane repeat protein
MSALGIEPLEDRCLPSAALPLDLGAGLDGDDLLSDPLFATDQGHKNSKALLAALTAPGNLAGNAATPATGGTISGSASPFVGHSIQSVTPSAPVLKPSTPVATLTVNTLADEATKDSALSLREAIELVDGALKTTQLSANELAQVSGTPGPNSLIEFAPGLTGTIHLLSPLAINKNQTTLQGPGAGVITVDCGLTTGILVNLNVTQASISGLTWANGRDAIVNRGDLTVSSCTFAYNNSPLAGATIVDTGAPGNKLTVQGSAFNNNSSGQKGAAIYGTLDTVSISNSTFTSNTASKYGGAIYDGGGSVSITGSKFTKDTSDAYGSAVDTRDCTSVTISNCTITGNHAARTGALNDEGSTLVTINNDTVTGNYVYNGVVYGRVDQMVISNTTISNNIGHSGGGIGWVAVAGSPATTSLTVTNTRITGNQEHRKGGGVYLLNDTAKYAATFTNCYIGNNYAAGDGGGVYLTDGTVTFNYCLIANNTSGRTAGGGIFNNDDTSLASVTLNHCTISGNKAMTGGGVFNYANDFHFGEMYINNSTVSGNTATTGNGGGCYNHGTRLRLINATVANNVATTGKGGGIYETGYGGTNSSLLYDTTIAFNQATAGGGIYTKAGAAYNGSVGYVYNTIVAANTLVGSNTASDIAGATIGTAKHDLIGTGGTGGITATNGNQINVPNPMLGTLASNGGQTQTIMLLKGSPAIDAGDQTLKGVQLTDQRGLTRVVGAKVDIGALEVQPAGKATHFVTQVSPIVSAGIPSPLAVTVEDDFSTVITGFTGAVTFTSGDPTATLPTPYTFTAADTGHHNFTFTLNTLGTQFIFLTDAADKLSAVSSTFVVSPPARGAAFIDGSNQLWVFQNGKLINTGGFAKTFSAGIDEAGNAEVWFLDGTNQLWKWDNGVFTSTGGFALHIAAGNGLVAFSDGVNQLWTFDDFGGGFTNTGGFASRFTVGFDVFGNNQIDFADGVNQLWTFDPRSEVFTNTGGFTKLFVAGQDAFGNSEIWFTDGNNQIWRLDQGKFTQTSGFALTITGSANGQMYFSDGVNQIWQLTDFGAFTNTSGFASHISGSAGTTALYFSDGINQLWELFNGAFTNSGGFASNFSAF